MIVYDSIRGQFDFQESLPAQFPSGLTSADWESQLIMHLSNRSMVVSVKSA
jgi:hypothetical protein